MGRCFCKEHSSGAQTVGAQPMQGGVSPGPGQQLRRAPGSTAGAEARTALPAPPGTLSLSSRVSSILCSLRDSGLLDCVGVAPAPLLRPLAGPEEGTGATSPLASAIAARPGATGALRVCAHRSMRTSVRACAPLPDSVFL